MTWGGKEAAESRRRGRRSRGAGPWAGPRGHGAAGATGSDPGLPPGQPPFAGLPCSSCRPPGAAGTVGRGRGSRSGDSADPVSVGVPRTQHFGQLCRREAVVSNSEMTKTLFRFSWYQLLNVITSSVLGGPGEFWAPRSSRGVAGALAPHAGLGRRGSRAASSNASVWVTLGHLLSSWSSPSPGDRALESQCRLGCFQL